MLVLNYNTASTPKACLPVSKIPIETPTLDIKTVSSQAFLQKGVPDIPNAVINNEKPADINQP